MPSLLILRGAPGSGKDTYAKKLRSYKIVSADDYHMKNGIYIYDISKSHEAHEWCFKEVGKLLSRSENVVLCNTMCQNHEVTRYLKAYENIANIGIIRLLGQHGNSHDVPLKKVEWFICKLAHEPLLQREEIADEGISLEKFIMMSPDRLMYNDLSREDKMHWISITDQESIRDVNLKIRGKRSLEDHQRYLASCVNTMMPPQRLEWGNIRVKDNLKVSSDGTILLRLDPNEYDDSSLVINLTTRYPKLAKVLKKSLVDFPRVYVFEHNKTALGSEGYLSLVRGMYKDYIGKDCDIMLLRRAYVNHIGIHRMCYNDLEEIADEMRVKSVEVLMCYRVVNA